MANVLSHLVMSHAHEPGSNRDLLLEVGGQVSRGSHRLLDRGRLVSYLSGSDNLGTGWRVWRLIIAARNFIVGQGIGALLSAHRPAAHSWAACRPSQSRALRTLAGAHSKDVLLLLTAGG